MKFNLLFFIIVTINIHPQRIVEKYQPPEGYLRIGPETEQMIPMVEKGFTLILPEAEEAKGVIVVPEAKRPDVKQLIEKKGTLEYEAFKKNIAVLCILSGNPLDFYFDDEVITKIVKQLQSVIAENNLKGKPVYFTGFSLGGTRALKLVIFLQSNREKYWMQPSGVAIIDAPLDMIRFWKEENRAMVINFHPDASGEGKWVTYLLKENLGTPEENYNNYVSYSPFVYNAEEGGNAKYLRNIPVRAYHEPDVNWWIENRRQDYYSMNSIDLAALINQLKVLHNDEAELITTYQKRDGFSTESSPHTDTFVDYAELMDWFLTYEY